MKVMMNTSWFKPILNPIITKFKYFKICKFQKKKQKLKFWVHLSFEMVFDVKINIVGKIGRIILSQHIVI